MSTCITSQMWKESIDKEKKRLMSLEEEGFDIAEAMSDLEAMDKAWQDKNEESMIDAVAGQISKVKVIDQDTIDRLNANNPRKGKVRVEVVSGYVDANNKVMYEVKFPKGNKTYTYNSLVISANQVDPRQMALNAVADDKIEYDTDMREVDEALTSVEAAHDLIDELGRLDGKKDSDEQVKSMKDFVEMFVGKGFTENVRNYVKNEASRTAGSFKFDENSETGEILVSASKAPRVASNEMSAAQKWVHEIGHAVTEFALRRKDPETRGTVRRLRELRNEARKAIKPEHLMPKNSIDRDAEMKIAQDLWDYMFSNEESGESEFLVHAVTNEEVRRELQKIKVYTKPEKEYANLFENIVDKTRMLIGKIVRKFRDESEDMQGDELAMKLMKELAKANNKAAHIKREQNAINKVFEVLVDKEDKLREVIDKYRNKLKGDNVSVPPVGASAYDLAKWFVKNAPKLAVDDRYKEGFEIVMSLFGMKPEGPVQSWIRKMVDADTLSDAVEQLDALSQQIDSRRMTRESITVNSILDGFEKKLANEEMEAMGIGALGIDLESVFNNYSKNELEKLYSDRKYLDSEIDKKAAELDSVLKNDKDKNWMKTQAKGLGFYMVTGLGHEAQVLNARNIVSGFGRKSGSMPDEKVVKLVDELATLHGLAYTDISIKSRLSELVRDEYQGMSNFINTHRAFKKESETKLFHGEKHRQVKGYTKDINNADISIEIAPMSDELQMKFMGYRLHKKMEVEGKGEIGVFVNEDQINPRYNKQALRFNDAGRMGTTLSDIGRMFGDSRLQMEVTKKKAQVRAKRLVESIEKGEFDPKEIGQEGRLNPMFNAVGEVVNFRYMMGRANKRALLEQDMRAPLVLGRMIAGIQDKVDTKEHNKKVLEAIEKDYEINMKDRLGKIGRNRKEYIKISKGSVNKEVEDLWSILPTEIRSKLEKKYKNGIWVRRDMLHMYFGNRDLSVVNAPLIQKLHPKVKHILRQTELMWQELMKLVKVEIIIKTPAVIVGNILSNFLYGVMTGNNPIEVAKLQMEAVRDMREFMNMNRELIELEIAKKNGKLADVGKIPLLKEAISKHAMKEFASEGLFQAIIEDVGINDLKASSKITKKLNEKLLDKLPSSARNGLDWLYLSDRTSFFKLITAATQLSDAAARKAKMDLDKRRYDRLVSGGTSRRDALKKVFLMEDDKIVEMRKTMTYDEIFKRVQVQEAREAFVNYSGEDRVTKYANDMGLVMFTKYLQRIQKVIKKGAVQHPISFMLMLLGQSFVTGELDTIDDKFMDLPYSPDYLDRMLDLVVPASFDLAGDVYKIAT